MPGKAGFSFAFLLPLPKQGRAGAGRAAATGMANAPGTRILPSLGSHSMERSLGKEHLGHSLLSPPWETWGPALPRHSQGSPASSLGGVSLKHSVLGIPQMGRSDAEPRGCPSASPSVPGVQGLLCCSGVSAVGNHDPNPTLSRSIRSPAHFFVPRMPKTAPSTWPAPSSCSARAAPAPRPPSPRWPPSTASSCSSSSSSSSSSRRRWLWPRCSY